MQNLPSTQAAELLLSFVGIFRATYALPKGLLPLVGGHEEYFKYLVRIGARFYAQH